MMKISEKVIIVLDDAENDKKLSLHEILYITALNFCIASYYFSARLPSFNKILLKRP